MSEYPNIPYIQTKHANIRLAHQLYIQKQRRASSGQFFRFGKRTKACILGPHWWVHRRIRDSNYVVILDWHRKKKRMVRPYSGLCYKMVKLAWKPNCMSAPDSVKQVNTVPMSCVECRVAGLQIRICQYPNYLAGSLIIPQIRIRQNISLERKFALKN